MCICLLIICSAKEAFVHLMALLLHFQGVIWSSIDSILTTVTFKTIAPRATSYLWRPRDTDIYAYVDLGNLIKTFYTAHRNSAHND